jgi:hypothetical protein
MGPRGALVSEVRVFEQPAGKPGAEAGFEQRPTLYRARQNGFTAPKNATVRMPTQYR